MGGPGAQNCPAMLARNNLLAVKICAPDFCLEPFTLLQQWQRDRLAVSFSDLNELESYRPACDFFLAELYGGLDFCERDQQMERVMPVMIRFLSNKVLLSLASAFELQAISLEFDLAMAEIVTSRGLRELDIDTYGSIYRACDDRPMRERQILLIRQLGLDLAHLVDRPMVTRLVRLLRGPAHASGFGKLQEFLETGLRSFRKMKDSDFFINTIYQREWQTMQKLFAGDENPFRI